jgi:GNAT superfamily N-acetyltransferase
MTRSSHIYREGEQIQGLERKNNMTQPTIHALTFRVGNAQTDYDTFAALLNVAEGTNINADSLRSWDKNKVEGDVHLRYAACLDEEIIGYGVIYNAAIDSTKRFLVWLTIDTNQRQQGFGSQFYHYLIQQAIENGAAELSSVCMDNDAAALAFAEKRGFTIRRHSFSSRLDLTTFDTERFLPLVAKAQEQGIRFTSLAAEGNTEAAQRKLFELNETTANDNPSAEGRYQDTFASFQARIFGADWFRADGQILAVDGERYVGLGAVGFEPDGATAFNAFTGIDKEYRGRGIAQALKVLAAQYAKSKGATVIATGNDSENARMLAVNDKLGYVRQTGQYWLIKRDLNP